MTIQSAHKVHGVLPEAFKGLVFTGLLVLTLAGCDDSEPAPPPDEPTPQAQCEGLSGKTVEGASIDGAQLVAAAGSLPEYCKVLGSLPPALQFEVRLPSAWNGRTVYAGGGGYNGSIPSTDAYTPRGYVSIASNGGHTGTAFDGSFALDPVKLEDYASLAIHRVLPVAKALIQQRYGKGATKTYFEGCSNGGREALIEAQRWPEDFDGIIARAPAYNLVELFLTFNQHTRQLLQPGANPDAKLQALSQATMAACDAKDGLADGIISHLAACTFEPSTLRCTGADSATCLTAAQEASVQRIYSPELLKGQVINAGWPAGGEADPGAWSPWKTGGGNAATSLGANFGSGMVKFFITQDPAYDPLAFEPDAWASRIQEVAAKVSANSTDLSRFRARGGKLILWHGGTDAAISINGTTAYYQGVVQASGGQAQADTFVEYFTAPGVNHCVGGAGADSVDLLGALENWTDKGVAPSQAGLVATKRNAQTGQTVLTRPLCKYPQYPRYQGTGDVQSAASFTCTAP
jgi:hypothetical protein